MKFNGMATDNLASRPPCDICAASGVESLAAVDGATDQGPWAYMCTDCHYVHGKGLGEGVGQVLLCGDEMDTELRKLYRLPPPTPPTQRELAQRELAFVDEPDDQAHHNH